MQTETEQNVWIIYPAPCLCYPQWCRKPKFGNLVINDEAAAALIEETLLEPLMNIRICISILLVHTALGLSNFNIDTEHYSHKTWYSEKLTTGDLCLMWKQVNKGIIISMWWMWIYFKRWVWIKEAQTRRAWQNFRFNIS